MEEKTISEVLTLSFRTKNRFEENHVTTIGDVMILNEPTVMGWKNAGAKVWDEVRTLQDVVRSWCDLNSNVVPSNHDPILDDPIMGDVPEAEPVKVAPGHRVFTVEEINKIIGILDWASDACSYDKKMARDHIANVKKEIVGSA